MPINSFLYPGPTNSNPYVVENSCRFNDGDSPYLSRTFGTNNGEVYKWTYSFWVKRSSLGEKVITASRESGTNNGIIRFTSGDAVEVYDYRSGFILQKITSRLFRDFSAWLNIVVSNDNSVSSPDTKIYINGVEETSFSTDNEYSQNERNSFNSDYDNYIGQTGASSQYFDGYMAEVCFIDGLALTPTSFGEFDSDSPTIWKPIDVSGLTFGTNGFYLDYEDSAALGDDVSGNSNDFTVTNLAATDQATDTPTNNFATLNPLIPSGLTYSEGNLGSARTDSGNRAGYGTFGVTAGKWYWEVKCVAAGTASAVGIGKETNMSNANQGLSQYAGSETNDIGYYTDGNINESASSIDSETSWTDGDIISVAMDLDNNKVYFAKNGTWQNSGDPSAGSNGYSITNSSDTFFPQISHHGATDASALSNFGTPPFSISSSNSDPNGYGSFEYGTENFYALCTKNLAEYG